MKIKLIVTLLLVTAYTTLTAQFESLSPSTSIKQVVGNTTITIDFERPAARKRKIFGGLVPWNKVWRTGAGHCTKVSFSRKVTVGGQAVAAGKYSLFTIPGKRTWMVILNTDTTLYKTNNHLNNPLYLKL